MTLAGCEKSRAATGVNCARTLLWNVTLHTLFHMGKAVHAFDVDLSAQFDERISQFQVQKTPNFRTFRIAPPPLPFIPHLPRVGLKVLTQTQLTSQDKPRFCSVV